MGCVLVRRPDDSDGPRRKLWLAVDGRKVVGLRAGAEVLVDVPDGSHVVEARSGLARSYAATLDVGREPVTVTISAPSKGLFARSLVRDPWRVVGAVTIDVQPRLTQHDVD